MEQKVGVLSEDFKEYLLLSGVQPDTLNAFLKSPIYTFCKTYWSERLQELQVDIEDVTVDLPIFKRLVGRIDTIRDNLALWQKLWEICYPPKVEIIAPPNETELERNQRLEAEEAYRVQEKAKIQRANAEAPFKRIGA